MKTQSLPLLLALSTLPAMSCAAPTLSIESDQSTPLVPSQVVYEPTNGGIRIWGEIVKRIDRRGRMPGHVDLEILTADGTLLAQYKAPLTNFHPSPKNPDQADFSLRIDHLPTGAQVIRVHYDGGFHGFSGPEHS